MTIKISDIAFVLLIFACIAFAVFACTGCSGAKECNQKTWPTNYRYHHKPFRV